MHSAINCSVNQAIARTVAAEIEHGGKEERGRERGGKEREREGERGVKRERERELSLIHI